MAFSDRFTDRLRFPILLAVVTLLLLPLPASAQITVLPTQEKSLGSASAPEPGVFVAQLPGADDAIRAASAEGWVTVLFVVIVLASFGTLGYLIRQPMKEAREREERASARIGQLEDFIRMKLMESLESNSIVMQKILAAAESICEAANEMSSAIAHCRLSGSQVDQRVAQRPDA